jgi:hypothetical protein
MSNYLQNLNIFLHNLQTIFEKDFWKSAKGSTKEDKSLSFIKPLSKYIFSVKNKKAL